MNNWMIYWVQVASCHALLVVFYFLALRKLTFYRINRAYLLSALGLGFLLPLIEVGWMSPQEMSPQIVQMLATRITQISHQSTMNVAEPFKVDIVLLFGVVYGAGLLFFLSRYFINYFKIKQFKNLYPLISQSNGAAVFRTPHTQPFSFFNAVFVPQHLEDRQAFDLVMAHELWHVKLGHSLDRMLVDFILVLFWFNPFIYFLRKLMVELHEYQVDALISSDSSVKVSYQQLLLQLAGGQLSGPVSFFNFSTIKQRIEMMNCNKSKHSALLRGLFVLPLLGGMIMLFSFNLVNSNTVVSVNWGPSFSQESKKIDAALWRDDQIPSILPLKMAEDKVEVTSHFGMRYDPIKKKRKHHTGIDFKADIGTPIIATADGIVSVSEEFDNWGKRIDIDHADGYMTRFAHLTELGVAVGDQVRKGQVIGKTGNSGMSKGPHLHYEVSKNNISLNPVDYIKDFVFNTQKQIPPNKVKANPSSDSDPKEVAELQEIELAKLKRMEKLAHQKEAEASVHRSNDALKVDRVQMEKEAQLTKEQAENQRVGALAKYRQAEMIELEALLHVEMLRAKEKQKVKDKSKNKDKTKS